MKILIYVVLIFIGVNLTAQNKEFSIEGKVVDNSKDGWLVYLQAVSDNGLGEIESTSVADGKFSFKGVIKEDMEVRILSLVKPKSKEKIGDYIFLEAGTIHLSVDSIFTVKGSDVNDKHAAFKSKQTALLKNIETIDKQARALYDSGNLSQEQAAQVGQELTALINEVTASNVAYISENIDNPAGELYFLMSANYIPLATLDELYKLTRPQFQNNDNIKSFMDANVWNKGDLVLGSKFKDIELGTPNGEKAKLSTLIEGKRVTLIDFWASWCAPCRKEMPFLVKTYEAYKDRGLEIVGISLDENKNSWVATIKNMKLTWPHLSDLGGWESAAAKKYSITRVPQNCLLDKDGVIIALDLHGADLTNKLEELLKD